MKTLSVDILKKLSVKKVNKVLTEENKNSDDIMVYMNTWKNYNEYGADLEAYGIKDGWMTPEEGLEFCKKYADDEPFINDVDNCPFEVSEYDNAPSKLEDMIKYNEFENKTLLKNAMETGMYDSVEDYIDILERGDYLWFPGVDNDEQLGREYVEMIGGTSQVGNPSNYFDRDSWKEDVRADEENYYREEYGYEDESDWEEHEDDFENYLDNLADEIADNYDGSDESIFDYEKLGEELSYDFTYTSDGAIQLL